jgi:hypothetical protein
LTETKKYKQFSEIKEIGSSILFALLLNIIIIILVFILAKDYMLSVDMTASYIGFMVGIIGVYGTIVAISINLSQEYPLKLLIKYFINSRFNLSFVFTILINGIFAFCFSNPDILNLFQTAQMKYFLNTFLLISMFSTFCYFLFFVIFFWKQIIVEKFVAKSFVHMLGCYKKDFTLPQKINNYIVENEKDFYIIRTSEFLNQHYSIESEAISQSNLEFPSEIYSKLPLKPKIIPLYFGRGKLKIKDFNFLKSLHRDFQIVFPKYVSKDLQFTPSSVYSYLDRDENMEVIEAELARNIEYSSIDKKEFDEVYSKLLKNGNPEKLLNLVYEYISKSTDIDDKLFILNEFDSYFLNSRLTKLENVDKLDLLKAQISYMYDKKELFVLSPKVLANFQNELLDLLVKNIENDSAKSILKKGGHHITAFIDYRYYSKFEVCSEENWLMEYSNLIANTIENLKSFTKYILESNEVNPAYKVEIFELSLGYLNRISERIHTDSRRNLNKDNKSILKLKNEIITNSKNYLNENKFELFFYTLYLIEKNNLDKKYFDIVLKMLNEKDSKNFPEYYYATIFFNKLDNLTYDEFTGGAQFIAGFNFNKYRLVVSIYKFRLDAQFDLSKFPQELFLNERKSLETEIGLLDINFVNKYFECSSDILEQFKKVALEIVRKRKIELKRKKEKYLSETPLVEEYTTKFKNDCFIEWEKGQNKLKQFLDYIRAEGGCDIEKSFLQNKLFEREWFLESFDNTVALARDAGVDFGQNQARSKLNKIITKINALFSKEKDEIIKIHSLDETLKKIIENDSDYYLFCNLDIEIWKLPNLVWTRNGEEDAIITINNSKIYIYQLPKAPNILIKKHDFILKQYSQGYKKINNELVILIDKLTPEDIEQLKAQGNSDLKLAQQLKILVSEKFEIQRKPTSKIYKLVQEK